MKINYDQVTNDEDKTANTILTCKFSPESKYLAVGDSAGKLNIYETGADKKIHKVTRVHPTTYRSRRMRSITTGRRRGRSSLRSDASNGLVGRIRVIGF